MKTQQQKDKEKGEKEKEEANKKSKIASRTGEKRGREKEDLGDRDERKEVRRTDGIEMDEKEEAVQQKGTVRLSGQSQKREAT